MNIDCPHCKKENDIDSDYLPDAACEDAEYQCDFCEKEFSFGWYAELELR